MMGHSADAPVVALSTAIYRRLLFLYPARFEQEYGRHMVQVFRDCCLRASRQGGGAGLAELWVVTLFDLARSLIEQHSQKETGMSHSNFIRLSGWALMLTAAIFPLFFVFGYLDETIGLPSGPWSLHSITNFAVILASPVLLAVGLLGIRSRYGEGAGGFGRGVLLVGVVAGLAASLIGNVGAGVFGRNWFWWSIRLAGYWDVWLLQYAGPAIQMACLALYGIPALSKRPMPRWNALPLLAGFGLPAMFLIAVPFIIAGNDPAPMGFAGLLLSTVQWVAMFMLGYVLQGDAVTETATPLPAAQAR